MSRLKHTRETAARRVIRTRSHISGTLERPRLSVNISNLHVSAQVIDDSAGKTLAYATTVGKKLSGNLSDKAAAVGAEIAQKCKKIKVNKVVLDRGSRRYHGRVKALADAARDEGLEF